MAPTTTQEEGGEASGSRSRARRRRRSAPARSPTSPATTQPTVAESEPAPPPSQHGKTKRARAAKERSKRRKRARAAENSRVEDENLSRSDKGAEEEEEEAAAAAASASAATEQGPSSEASSAASSPLHWPHFAPNLEDRIDPAIVVAQDELESKFFAKQRRQLKLSTLDESVPRSCLVSQKLLPVRESAEKTVLQTAKSVLGLSSYLDGKLLRRSSGFLIDWDEKSKDGTVLTSASLICSKSSLDQWSGEDLYAPNAEVQVHLLDKDDTTAPACLLYYHEHYQFALFKIKIDLSAQIPCFSSEVNYGQEIFILGRDESMYLTANHGSTQYLGPSTFERHHYMYISCAIAKCDTGGPVIDFNGQVLGMAHHNSAFIPSSIILKCLDHVPRLHVGMKFSAIKFLEPAHKEKISRKCNVDAGLIVKEVSVASPAEKMGIRIGDIIDCWNGKCIDSTVELENLFLQMCEEHLEGNITASTVDIQVGLFHTRKGSHCTLCLTANVSDDVEVISNRRHLEQVIIKLAITGSWPSELLTAILLILVSFFMGQWSQR
ncbi:hypothetical protein ACP70R_048436 [Stipagrostis hirtigluma subsp. patula]